MDALPTQKSCNISLSSDGTSIGGGLDLANLETWGASIFSLSS